MMDAKRRLAYLSHILTALNEITQWTEILGMSTASVRGFDDFRLDISRLLIATQREIRQAGPGALREAQADDNA